MFPSVLLMRASLLALVSSASRGNSIRNISPLVATRTTITSATTPTSLFMSTTSAGDTTGTEPKKQYVLRYAYVPDVLERRGPYREEHLALAKRSCISGGPTASTKNPAIPTGALFIFPDSLTALSFVDKDPYVTYGIVTAVSIEEWTVAIEN